jgi:4a-hydroxytetrahydrobiopterin dehydratase
MAMDFAKKKCVPCEGGVPVLTKEQVKQFLPEVPGWEGDTNSRKISKRWKFKNFVEAMQFVNKVAELAEEEGHHPDIHVSYSRVTLELWTHAIGGLSENDFILSAKINALVYS